MTQLSATRKLRLAPVSVIIPCYRCIRTVQRAVDSVIAQTLPAAEIILVDDFSNDDDKTLGILDCLRQKYQDSNIKILRCDKNNGPGSARNAAWEVSSQPYLAFLDSDDSWHPEKLAIQLHWMMDHPSVSLSGHLSIQILENTALPILPGGFINRRVNMGALLFSNRFPTRSVMLKRDIQYRFIPDKRYAEDYLLWLTIVASGQNASFLRIPMAYSFKNEFGDEGLTGSLWKMQQGVLDTYKRLFTSGDIPFITLILCSGFSLLKFLRRLGIVKLRALFQEVSGNHRAINHGE